MQTPEASLGFGPELPRSWPKKPRTVVAEWQAQLMELAPDPPADAYVTPPPARQQRRITPPWDCSWLECVEAM